MDLNEIKIGNDGKRLKRLLVDGFDDHHRSVYLGPLDRLCVVVLQFASNANAQVFVNRLFAGRLIPFDNGLTKAGLGQGRPSGKQVVVS